MNDFSIKLSAEGIVDSRTKRYFSEVYGCYTSGYYRSAVVMLWSVVVTDILLKMEQLATAYGDATASAILAEIGQSRKNNPKSPEWESELVNKVASRTDLIDQAELASLSALQSHRHLSAHPVMTATETLFSPNKETARAHIRNALDGVLTKPPIMSRKVFDAFMEDVEQVGKLSPGSDGITKVLEAKYFRHFSPTTFAHIFKSLWRVAFKSTDARSDANREVNTQTLGVVFTKKRPELTELIRSERDWFSDVSFSEGPLTGMIHFFTEYPHVFPLLTDAVKTPIEKFSELNIDNFAQCWFISPDPQEHVEVLLKKIETEDSLTPSAYIALCDSLKTSDARSRCNIIGMKIYFGSTNFDTADSRFDDYIRPSIPDYDRECVKAFISGCETCYNGQAVGRVRSSRDHALIKTLIDTRFADIPIPENSAFKASL